MAITAEFTPSRTTGYAPLYVQFDATATRSDTENTKGLAFRNLYYVWDFGDPSAGTWGVGNTFLNSKNEASGGIAAHVYENPGVYTVTLKVYDINSVVDTVTDTVTVSDVAGVGSVFSGSATVAIATNGDFSGAPTGAHQVTTSNLATALGSFSTTRKRLLFRRGQTWSTSVSTTITTGGRLIMDAFSSAGVPGTGAKPILTSSSPDTPGTISLSTSDASMSDIEVRNSSGQVCLLNGDGAGGNWSKITLVRLTTTTPIYSNEFAGNGIHSEICFYDCDINGSYASYFASEKAAIMGCTMDGQGTPVFFETVGTFRTQYFTTSVFQHNRIINSGTQFHLLKWGGPKRAGGASPSPVQYQGLDSEYSVISDNDLDDTNGFGGWLFAIGAENIEEDERVHDCIFERNWIRFHASSSAGDGPAATEVAHKIFGTVDCVFRNNLIDATRGNGQNDHVASFQIERRGVEPVPTGNRIYNNTMFRAASPAYSNVNQLSFAKLSSDAVSTAIKNNIAYTPSVTNNTFLNDSGSATSASSNTSTGAMTTINPFVSAGTIPEHFQISSGTYADGTGGDNLKVFDDYFGNIRDVFSTVNTDMGFYALNQGTLPSDPGGVAETKIARTIFI